LEVAVALADHEEFFVENEQGLDPGDGLGLLEPLELGLEEQVEVVGGAPNDQVGLLHLHH